uniref:B30.2/SPRY domain-containing protein n=1 Tax=Oryzias melastigma TaxID=30732 RepID=A0A3B3CUZ5_ORYME
DISEEIFNQMIRLLQRRSSEVTQQIRSQQELEQMSTPSGVRPLRYFEEVRAAVSKTRDKLEKLLDEEGSNISLTVADVDVFLAEQEPKTRVRFLLFADEIQLDPDSANPSLLLSDGSRKAAVVKQPLSVSDPPDRFTVFKQVLSVQSLSRRSYWEVERRGGVCVAVAYKNISRAGSSDACLFGSNDRSWALRGCTKSYTFCHNNEETRLSAPLTSRVGVYLDHGAGVLSFYSVSETMTLIHRVHTTFTEPLHAGLWLYAEGDSAEILKLK